MLFRSVRHGAGVDLAAVQRKVTSLGYGVAPLTAATATFAPQVAESHEEGHDHADGRQVADAAGELHGHDHGRSTGPWWQSGKGRLTIASGVALVLAYGLSKLMPQAAPWLFVAAMLIGLVPIARRAVMAALAGAPFTIEMLMTIAAVGAVIIGAGEEGAAVVFLFLIGELLEGVAAGKARASIQSLTKLVPKTALLEEGAATREVPAESLAVGAVILVRPGDRIPADGVIVAGESSIDEAPVTGESTPLHKGRTTMVWQTTIRNDAGKLCAVVTQTQLVLG